MAHLCRLLTRRAIPMHRALGTSAVNRGEAVAHSGDSSVDHPKVEDKRAIIGRREIVGYGFNGMHNYVDRYDYPFPAIRFKEDTAEILGLKTKEKGDWKSMTLDEKKTLYRASFGQTYSEFLAPTGDYKSVLAIIILFVSLTNFVTFVTYAFMYSDKPITMEDEWMIAQIKQGIVLNREPATGYASQFDYEKNEWKK